jgi:sec-independent protein translocase protein TatC
MSPITKSYRRAAEGMTIVEHLKEARRRLIVSIASVFILGTFAFIDYNQILGWLRRPYCETQPTSCSFYVLAPLDGLTLRIKIAIFGGLLLATPVIFYQLWRFITPGLRDREKRYVIPFLATSVSFFLGGCIVAYFTFEHSLKFLQSIGGNDLQAHYNPVSYLNLILLIMLVFGIVFEFPVVLVTLELLNIVTPNQLLRATRWAIIAVTVVSAVITPSGDPFSMLVMASALLIFYYGAIGFGKLIGK